MNLNGWQSSHQPRLRAIKSAETLTWILLVLLIIIFFLFAFNKLRVRCIINIFNFRWQRWKGEKKEEIKKDPNTKKKKNVYFTGDVFVKEIATCISQRKWGSINVQMLKNLLLGNNQGYQCVAPQAECNECSPLRTLAAN